jgi:TRIAD3 protein (E3 ubiquitin-protein ligase RNF216)
MVQCADAHLFCSGCIRTYAGTKLGEQSCALVCMDTAGCSAAFAESELRRVLDPGLLGLYERLRARDALKGAALENLTECPFCEYACVMEDEADRLFRCQSETCGVVSCRLCKKPVSEFGGGSRRDADAGQDHTPKSCKEVDDDKRLGAQHTVEEAMSACAISAGVARADLHAQPPRSCATAQSASRRS